MILSNDFKNGMTIEYNGNLYAILEFLHVKPGKGAAFVCTKLRNMRTGTITEYSFQAGEKVKQVILEKIPMQYIYEDGANKVFMNNETYEQIEIPTEKIKNESRFLVEGMEVEVLSIEGEILGLKLPDKVVLKITQTDPATKGVSGSAKKDAILETGHKILVPLFIETGESVIVSTDTGEYDSRA